MLAWAIDAAKASGADRIVTVLSRDSASTQDWLGQEEFAIQHRHSALVMQCWQRARRWRILTVSASCHVCRHPASSKTLVYACRTGCRRSGYCHSGFRDTTTNWLWPIIREADGKVQKIVEERDTTREEAAITLVNGGIMATRTPLLFDLLDSVDTSNAQNEIYLTDIVSVGRSRGCSIACEVTDGDELMEVNSRADLAHAEALLQAQLRLAAMASGVTLQAPDTVFLSADSVIERDVSLNPMS